MVGKAPSRRAVLLLVLPLALIQSLCRADTASSDLVRGSASDRRRRALLGSDNSEYGPNIEEILGRRKCLGLTKAWSPFKAPKRDASGAASEEASDPSAGLGRRRRRLSSILNATTLEHGGDLLETGRDRDREVASRHLLRSRHGYHIPPRWQRPLTSRCRDENKIKKNVKSHQKPVVDCLLSDKDKCPIEERATLEVLHATESLRHILPYETPCITVNKMTRRCATTQGNPETMRMGSVPSSKYSLEDVERNYTSCALIGNGPGLFKQNKGSIIDAHDAVFRFNSLHNVQYQGKKTTFRLLNNKRVEGITKKHVRIKEFTPGEAWIMWHYFSLKKYAELKKMNDNSRIMAPDYLKFELRAYFGIRKDLKRFGNSMRCPMNLNSGMHGILMALKMCQEINLFGFSYQKNTVNNSQRNTRSKSFQSTVVSPRLSKHHDWHTDVLVIKYLAMAGILNIC